MAVCSDPMSNKIILPCEDEEINTKLEMQGVSDPAPGRKE
jgi:hypothetical protein